MHQLQQYWEHVRPEFAHLVADKYLPPYDELTLWWEQQWLNNLDVQDKVVVDYGIGTGWLGKYLLSSKGIKRYTGVDIALRSLKHTGRLLNEWDNITLLHTDDYYTDFNEPVHLFICQACIQHFPDEQYLNMFLEKLKLLQPDEMMLQIAEGKCNQFRPDYVVRSCVTTPDYISNRLQREIKNINRCDEPDDYTFITL